MSLAYSWALVLDNNRVTWGAYHRQTTIKASGRFALMSHSFPQPSYGPLFMCLSTISTPIAVEGFKKFKGQLKPKKITDAIKHLKKRNKSVANSDVEECDDE